MRARLLVLMLLSAPAVLAGCLEFQGLLNGESAESVADQDFGPAIDDADRDGIEDHLDNCPEEANSEQGDADTDGIGDACDDDRDGDGIDNEEDNCPDLPNPDQEDADEDGTGDACDDDPVNGDDGDNDNADVPIEADDDGDGVPNAEDNCPNVPNDSQQDLDADGIGDACDGETDTELGYPELPDDLETITAESGLSYIDMEVGAGEEPAEGDVIEAHYTGWLEEDGTKFDSSLDRGTPFTFALGTGQVIAGWDEGFATMRVGGKRRLIIPPELGYGASGAGATIPPNATLVFDVELLGINP